MSNTLITLALVVAVLSIPTVAGLTAWGLAGGDGEPQNVVLGLLAVVVGLGSIHTAVTCYTTYFFDPPVWRWWLMLAPPAAGMIGVLLPEQGHGPTTFRDRLLGAGLQLVLAVPAVLLLASDAVSLS